MLQLFFYVPEEYLDTVKEAVLDAGGGHIGRYDRCCWQVKGSGQFRPLKGSHAFQGTEMRVETLEEYRVELICSEDRLTSVVNAMKKAHPYEEVAYGIVRLANED